MKHTMKQYPGDVTLESLLKGRGVDNMPAKCAINMDALIHRRLCPYSSREISIALEILGAGEWNGGHARPDQVLPEGPPCLADLKNLVNLVLLGLCFDGYLETCIVSCDRAIRAGRGNAWKNALVRSIMDSAIGEN